MSIEVVRSCSNLHADGLISGVVKWASQQFINHYSAASSPSWGDARAGYFTGSRLVHISVLFESGKKKKWIYVKGGVSRARNPTSLSSEIAIDIGRSL